MYRQPKCNENGVVRAEIVPKFVYRQPTCLWRQHLYKNSSNECGMKAFRIANHILSKAIHETILNKTNKIDLCKALIGSLTIATELLPWLGFLNGRF